MSKIYGYFRVSTKLRTGDKEKQRQQDYERQKYLFEHSGIKCDEIFEERISGGIRGDQREQFNKLLSKLHAGDMVVFTESSRFGRNYKDCFDIVDLITIEYEASIKFLSNGMTLLGGKQLNPYEWMALSQFFLADEFQKRLIGYNTKNKLQALKEQGVHIGRKSTVTEEQRKFIHDNRLKMEQKEMAKLLGLSTFTVSKIANEQ